ncbi:MAG: DUF5060 domain-containing protein [bacterium]
MKCIIFVLIAQVLCFISIYPAIPAAYGQKDLVFESITPSSGVVGKYLKFEIDVKINLTFENPYDSEKVRLWSNFVSPAGKKYRVPGFYYQGFERSFKGKEEKLKKAEGKFWKDRVTGTGQWTHFLQEEKLKEDGKPVWKVRFTPTEEGKWEYFLEFEYNDERSISEKQPFKVIASNDPGFIRVSKKNPSYFAFDDGSSYFPVGQNVCWYRSTQDVSSYEREPVVGTGDYDRWYEDYGKNGANYSRIWFIPWGFGQEWNDTDTGLGDYDKGQRKAWRLDYVMDLAREKGIYTLFCLLPHGPFSTGVNSIWKDNPYNEDNSGPLMFPGDFITDPTAKKYFKNWLRYIVARWGYSPGVLAWEWWNEINWTSCIDIDELSSWIKEMTAFVESIDPNKHLFTISYSGIGSKAIWELPEISYVQIHGYDLPDYALYMTNIIKGQVKNNFGKPILFSEFAENSRSVGDYDPTGVHLHNGIWGAALTPGSAGSAMLWWWDVYTEPYDLYYHYYALSEFLRGEKWDEENFGPLNVDIIGNDDVDVYGVANSKRALLWIKYSLYYLEKYGNIVLKNTLKRVTLNKNDKRINPIEEDYNFSFLIEDAELQINDLEQGDYTVDYWDTYKGEIVLSEAVTVGDKESLVLKIPTFDKDIALRLYKK